MAARHLEKVTRNVTLISWLLVTQLRGRRAEQTQEFQGRGLSEGGWWESTLSLLFSSSCGSMDVEKTDLGSCRVVYVRFFLHPGWVVATLPFQPEPSCITSSEYVGN